MIGFVALAMAWDLDQIRDRAVRDALAVERAEALAAATRADAWSATSTALPSVTAFASVNTGQGFTSFGFERPVATQAGAGVRGSWVVLSPSGWAAATAARRTARGQEATAMWAMVEARRQATTATAMVLAAQAELEALDRAVEDARATADAVAALVDAELRPASEGARAEAEALGVVAERATAAWTAEARCAELLALLRESADGDCDVAPVPSWHEPSVAVGEHPALVASRAVLGAARASSTAAVGGLAPSLSLTGNAAWFTTSEAVGGFGWSAGAEVAVPVLDGGVWSGVPATRARTSAAELSLEEQERTLAVALRSAEARLRAAREGLAARESSLSAADAALVLVEERYRAGLADLTEWMDARRARDAAAVGVARGRGEVGVALAEVESARGVGV